MNAPFCVWLVREVVRASSDPARETEQDCYVVAPTATEAVQIVGEIEARRVVLVQHVCPITQLPGDRYRVQPWVEAKSS